MITEQELEQLEDDVTEAIAAAIGDLCDSAWIDGEMTGPLITIQPPETVIRHAARAAAQVLLAFERGYRMSE